MNVQFLIAYFALCFTAGTIFGAAMFMLYGLHQLKKINAKVKLSTSAREKDATYQSIKDRLTKAQEMTQRQFDILAAMDAPSKNSLHSRYKNQLSQEVRELETEKSSILRSIINDGFDPEITILNEKGQKEKLKLSEYLSRVDAADINSAPPPPPTDSGDPSIKKVGKFYVYSSSTVKPASDGSEETNN